MMLMVKRRTFLITGTLALALGAGGRAQTSSVPAPKWRPSFQAPIEKIVERFQHYQNNAQDFVVFKNGTCVHVDSGLTDRKAISAANRVLRKITGYHPDFNTLSMDDGNYLVTYNHPASNVILKRTALANWSDIESHHLDGLVRDEVLIGSRGHNIFDDRGKIGLLGRSYMFMDALNPKAVQVVRIQ